MGQAQFDPTWEEIIVTAAPDSTTVYGRMYPKQLDLIAYAVKDPIVRWMVQNAANPPMA